LSSATVRHVAQVFSRFTTTVSASFATVNARHEPTLVVLQFLASVARIGRDASERSVSPLQKRSKPPPVPEIPTVMFTLPAPALRKSSAAAVVYGPTVDDPSAVIVPDSLPSAALVRFGPTAAAASDASVPTRATTVKVTIARRRIDACFIRSLPLLSIALMRRERAALRRAHGLTGGEHPVDKW
jgi:hypothetical protein